MRSTVFAFLVLGSTIFASNGKMAANCCDPCQVNWSGLYIGANTGWGWSNANYSTTPFGATAVTDFTTQTRNNCMNGTLLGAQAGINWQMKRWLLGVEGDFDGTSINGYGDTIFASRLAPLLGSVSDNISSVYASIDWLTSLRGRLGRLWGPSLLYMTGGVVWENLTVNVLNLAQTGADTLARCGANIFHTTKTGWTVGAGCERMIASRWSVHAEYMYNQFSSGPILDVPFPNSATTHNGASVVINNTSINSFRLGLNYTFKRFQ